ncbi:MAG: amidophosphoribosyltransferase [Syntrophales bacterium]|jgi:amidophosphoribosyltransferase|nr:amidophosphoribosyltransferase [Syntrophales bacterium]
MPCCKKDCRRNAAAGLKEFCAVFGIFGDSEAARKTYLGLYSLQHRGQESSGIAASDGCTIALRKGMGLVSAVFSDREVFSKLQGNSAIGHNRYSTTGLSGIGNAQPILIRFKGGKIAAAHNGNIVNAGELRKKMENEGSIFQTTSDSEIVLHLIARSREEKIEEMIADSLGQVEGAYSFVFLTPDTLIAARDPRGFRPLCLGKTETGTVVASESCALDIINAEYLRDVAPGEVLSVGSSGISSIHLPEVRPRSFCMFEYIYFSRPDSIVFEEKVDKIRRQLGRTLAKEAPCDADLVIAVPDSANTAALGYAGSSGIRFEIGLIRNHYVGRTFIEPHQHERDLDVKIKFNTVSGVLKGKRVVVVEDSIVRGTTLRQLIHLIREAGAAEVHVRVSSPPIVSPCFYGIDISKSSELIAASHSIEEIRKFLGADSLAYLSVEGMLDTVKDGNDFCRACFTGNYPTATPRNFNKEHFGE